VPQCAAPCIQTVAVSHGAAPAWLRAHQGTLWSQCTWSRSGGHRRLSGPDTGVTEHPQTLVSFSTGVVAETPSLLATNWA
jgi:hypothetical protein